MPKTKKKGVIHDTLTGFDFQEGVDAPLPKAKAIRLKCLECQCANDAEVRRCQIYDCTLWPWRFGRPPRAGELICSEEEPETESDDTLE